MREVKFRAWHKTKHYMTPSFSIWKVNLAEDPNATDWVLMQYTGLKDKNGKEIYEGDIVNSRNRTCCVNREVYWDDKASQFRLCTRGDRQFDKTCIVGLAKEVIGNIYENPELAK